MSVTGSHPHGHPTATSQRVSPRVRTLVLAVLFPLVVLTVGGLAFLWPSGESPEIVAGVRTNAEILEVRPCADTAGAQPGGDNGGDGGGNRDGDGGQPSTECLEADAQIESGPDEGQRTVVPLWFGEGAPTFEAGDKVVLAAAPEQPLESRYEVIDFQRGMPLLWLAVLFAVAVVVLSRWKGLAALAGLAISILVIVVFVLPALLSGEEPLAVAVVGASVIMIATLYLAHGVSIRTSVALIGTLVALTLTGLLGVLFTALGQFTGLVDDAAVYVGTVDSELNVRGLLLAGLVIGALGVLDDTTVTQSATVWELAAADTEWTRGQLFAAGMRVGREHVAATVNTLVLAYVGASLPLLMLFNVSGLGVGDALTSEAVAQEVVRGLVGSLGIVAAVPVTTALAVLAVRHDHGDRSSHQHQPTRGSGRRAGRRRRT